MLYCDNLDCLLLYSIVFVVFFFCKQKTAYEMRISDWSSDVCSSDLHEPGCDQRQPHAGPEEQRMAPGDARWLRRRGQQGRRDGHGECGDAGQGGKHDLRTEERRVGKECVSKCRYRGEPTN